MQAEGERRKRVGRPGREPLPGERVGLSLRVTPEVKRSLDAAAERSGRSLSLEAELRLESFSKDEHSLREALALAYGHRIAGLLLKIGDAMKAAANDALALTFLSGVDHDALDDHDGHPDAPLNAPLPYKDALDDPLHYEQVEAAARTVLEWAKPPEQDREPPQAPPLLSPKERKAWQAVLAKYPGLSEGNKQLAALLDTVGQRAALREIQRLVRENSDDPAGSLLGDELIARLKGAIE
jgi:hypothetical protein